MRWISVSSVAGFAAISAVAAGCLSAVATAADLTWDNARVYGAESVRDRFRAAFVPQGTRIGNFIMVPEIGFRTSIGKDDTGGRGRDMQYNLLTALELRSQLPRHQLDVRAEGRAVARHDQEDFRYIDGKVRVLGGYDISHRTRLFGEFSVERTHEDDVDDERPNDARRAPALLISRAESGIKHRAGRIDAAIGARYARFEYDDTETNDGGIIDQSFRNHTQLEPFANVGYNFSPGYRVFGELSGLRIENRGNALIDRDAQGFQASGGVEFELSPLVRVMLKGGYFRQDYVQAGLVDISTFVYDARLDWYVSPLVSLTFNASRNVHTTTFGDASGRILNTLSVKADYEMWRNLILSAEGAFKLGEYVGEDRTDRIWVGRIGLDYIASKHWLITVGYEHQELVSSIGDFDRRLDRFTIGARYRF